MNIVYTAISNKKDILTQGNVTDGATFIAYLDNITNPDKLGKDGDWFIKKLRSKRNKYGQYEDFVRQAKEPKIIPHKYLYNNQDIAYSLWMDGNCRLKVPMRVLIDKYLKDSDIAFFPHPTRDCIYSEANMCRKLILDDVFTMEYQMAKYLKEGYPENNGLIDGSVILRRHTPQIAELNNLWWKEILNGSRRDQLSFNYAAWKLKIKYSEITGHNHVHTNSYFESVPHERKENI